MAANRKHYSSKEDIPKEGDEGGGSDEGGGGGGGISATTEPYKHGKDVVDFVLTSSKANSASVTNGKKGQEDSVTKTGVTLDKFNIFHLRRRPKSDPGTGPIAKHAASQQIASQQTTNGGVPPTGAEETLKKKKSRFVKSASIARIFGNTYNTKKYDDSSALLKLQQFKRSFLNSEKFHKKDSGAGAPEDNDDGELQIGDSCYVNDSENSAKAIKSITRGLGRLLRRNCHSIDISRPDPEYKVSYLGNVLTGWAKGDGCVEKPLATLWRNYTQNSKPDVMMKLCLCPSGLKATTRQHGLTEYWSHRITYCSSPKNYPRVFCWIYRHEGRKLKHEFRCHAVICSKETIAQEISTILKENLAKALREFKRDKLNRQNARLSLANSVYDNPSMPRRKIMLSVGGNNYRPPLERSKSAPKLMAIEEMIGEEDEEENEAQEGEGAMGGRTSKAETSSGGSTVVEACCREDALFPSTTLGRRRCRRGHSIRRSRLRNSFKSPKDVEARVPLKNENIVHVSPMNKSVDSILDTISQEDGEEDERDLVREDGEPQSEASLKQMETNPNSKMGKSSKLSHNSDSSEDDFEAFLAHYNYNSSEPLSTELISYFDMKLNPATVCSMHDLSQHHGSLPVTLEDTQRLALSLDDLDNYSLPGVVGESETPEVRTRELKDRDVDLETDEVFFNQDEVLEMLRTAAESAASVSHRRLSDERLRHSGCLHTEDDTAPPSLLCVTSKLQAAGGSTHPDSDEGSISSGCETSSTVTTNTDDSGASGNGSMMGRSATVVSLGKPGSVLERVRSFEQLAENQVIHVPLGEHTGHQVPQDVGNVTSSPELIFKRSITFPAPGVKSSFLIPMTMAGSATGASEPIDSPLDSLNSSLVEARRDDESHHQTTKPKVRQMRLKSTVAAVNTELINHLQAIDSDSEFSDESGYVEFQDNQPSIKSVTA
uniref:PID domain-containing protein n=2 Tax=Anopheles funestus TaxID=62324 RepID=A0A1Y9HE83_ANOFN